MNGSPEGDAWAPGISCSALSCDIFISQLCSMRGHYFLTTQFLGPFITQLGTGDAESSKMRLLPSSNTCLAGKMGMETNH